VSYVYNVTKVSTIVTTITYCFDVFFVPGAESLHCLFDISVDSKVKGKVIPVQAMEALRVAKG
jgi:hypothetical protein